MIRNGELEGELATDLDGTADETEGGFFNFSDRVRDSFHLGTEHLRKQRDEGITSEDRFRKIIRLMLMLLGMGFALWYFVFR